MAAAEAAKLFESIGLEPKTAASVASNAKLSAALRGVITEAGQLGGCDKAVGNLLYNMATKVRGAVGRGGAWRARARRFGATCAARGALSRTGADATPLAAPRAQFPANAMSHRQLVADYVSAGKIKARSAAQRLRRRCQEAQP